MPRGRAAKFARKIKRSEERGKPKFEMGKNVRDGGQILKKSILDNISMGKKKRPMNVDDLLNIDMFDSDSSEEESESSE